MLFIANNANAGERLHYTIICRDGMEFVYTGESSNYSPQDLCEDHGGLPPSKNSNNDITKNSSSDAKSDAKKATNNNTRDNRPTPGISVWFTPYALKPVYHTRRNITDGFPFAIKNGQKIGKTYKRSYSAGMTLQLRYAYLDVGVTSYAGNTALYPLYNLHSDPNRVQYFTTIVSPKTAADYPSYEDAKVIGGSYSSGLSLPFVFKRNKKMSVFAGLAYEHSFFMQTTPLGAESSNSNTLATSVGLRSSMGKFFIEAVSADTFKSFDFVPPQVYWGYDPSISFKIGISII